MATERHSGILDVVLFFLVLGVAGGARVWYLQVCADGGHGPGPLLVQDPPPDNELDSLVGNLRENQWFGSRAPFASAEEQTAHTAPGLPWMLYWLDKVPWEGADLSARVRWLQCGLGTLTALAYFLFALRAFGSRLSAVLAGLLCALHPIWIVNTAAINDGVLTSFLLALCLLFGSWGAQSGSAGASLLFGLSLAGLALVRAALLPFAFIALFGYVIHSRTMNRGWLVALLAFLGFANGLAPWTIRNYRVFHDAIPSADSAFVHLWMGNNSQSTGSTLDEPAMLATLADFRGEEPAALAAHLAQMSQVERYDQIGEEVLKQVKHDPAGTVSRRIQSGVCFVLSEQWLKDRHFWRSTNDSSTGPEWMQAQTPLIFNATMLGMLVLGLLGWRWTQPWSAAALPSALALIMIPLPYVLSHAETLHGPRLPMDGILLTFAAVAICRILSFGMIPYSKPSGAA
jgi:4-amino-4-deoxy-L-arabinose transferase-like glycosyltransferase